MVKKSLVILLYLALWELISILIHNALIFPRLESILYEVIRYAGHKSFWYALFSTFIRVLIGTGLAGSLALLLSLGSYKWQWVDHLLKPFLIITKTLPNVTYILIVLIWFSRELSVAIVSFLVVFPVMYGQLYGGLCAIHPDYLDVLKIYPEKRWEMLIKAWIPLIKPHLLEAIVLGISLGFKVGVMAEILGQVQPGLGYLFYSAKMNFEIASIFALSLWMILCVVVIEKGIRLWIRLD